MVVKAGRKGVLGLHSVLKRALGRLLLADAADSEKAQPWTMSLGHELCTPQLVTNGLLNITLSELLLDSY